LLGDTFISGTAATLANLQTSVPRFINQAEQVVLVLICMIVRDKSLIIRDDFSSSWPFELWSLLRVWNRLACDYLLYVGCSLSILYVDIRSTGGVDLNVRTLDWLRITVELLCLTVVGRCHSFFVKDC
jgi:hypothetical protein